MRKEKLGSIIACVLAMGVIPAPAQISETVLCNFHAPPKGVQPWGLIIDDAGNLFGTASSGGASDAGVVYQFERSGRQRVLYSFTGGADGANPTGSLIRDSAGNLYGTTSYGGGANLGVVFEVDARGNETVLHSFAGGSDGAHPQAGMVRDTVGNLYGAASGGGTENEGVVFKIDPSGRETVLYNFTGGDAGKEPSSGLVQDSGGNLYGTTLYGGPTNYGVVYKLDATGHETVLHGFLWGNDGALPVGVVLDSKGNLYGVTGIGGPADAGVLYKLDAFNNETILYGFVGAGGKNPLPGLVLDQAGNLYGTTLFGGSAGFGVVYKFDASGNQTVLYSFLGESAGSAPGGLVLDAVGNLYGTANGGAEGIIFEINAAGLETVLYEFPGGKRGANPTSGVVGDHLGDLYGTTPYGGVGGCGLVYKVDRTGRETVLYSFTGETSGCNPNSVILDSAGNLYGTTSAGGATNGGVVYKLDMTGHQTILHAFAGGTDGEAPLAGVIRDAAGNLYGTTANGGSQNAGVVYKIDTTGIETVLHDFGDQKREAYRPSSLVIDDASGDLYGSATYGGRHGAGEIFKLDAKGRYRVLHSFAGPADGANPVALTRDTSGNLYGITSSGGVHGYGVVYELDASGNQTLIYSFTGGIDGASPAGSLIRDSAGNLYGTTEYGGAANNGLVYQLDPTGTETVLYDFTGGADGGIPLAGVIRDHAGNLFGTALQGGRNGAGVVFRLEPESGVRHH